MQRPMQLWGNQVTRGYHLYITKEETTIDATVKITTYLKFTVLIDKALREQIQKQQISPVSLMSTQRIRILLKKSAHVLDKVHGIPSDVLQRWKNLQLHSSSYSPPPQQRELSLAAHLAQTLRRFMFPLGHMDLTPSVEFTRPEGHDSHHMGDSLMTTVYCLDAMRWGMCDHELLLKWLHDTYAYIKQNCNDLTFTIRDSVLALVFTHMFWYGWKMETIRPESVRFAHSVLALIDEKDVLGSRLNATIWSQLGNHLLTYIIGLLSDDAVRDTTIVHDPMLLKTAYRPEVIVFSPQQISLQLPILLTKIPNEQHAELQRTVTHVTDPSTVANQWKLEYQQDWRHAAFPTNITEVLQRKKSTNPARMQELLNPPTGSELHNPAASSLALVVNIITLARERFSDNLDIFQAMKWTYPRPSLETAAKALVYAHMFAEGMQWKRIPASAVQFAESALKDSMKPPHLMLVLWTLLGCTLLTMALQLHRCNPHHLI